MTADAHALGRVLIAVVLLLALSGCMADEIVESVTRADPTTRDRPPARDGWTREVAGSFAVPVGWEPASRARLRQRGLTPESYQRGSAVSPDGDCVVTRWGNSRVSEPSPDEVPEYLAYHAQEDLAQTDRTPFEVLPDDGGLAEPHTAWRRWLAGPTHAIDAFSLWTPDTGVESWLLFGCDDERLVQDIAATWVP